MSFYLSILTAPAAAFCVYSLNTLQVTGNGTACARKPTENLLTRNTGEVAMVAVATFLDNGSLSIDRQGRGANSNSKEGSQLKGLESVSLFE